MYYACTYILYNINNGYIVIIYTILYTLYIGNKYQECYSDYFYLSYKQSHIDIKQNFINDLPFGEYKLLQYILISKPNHIFMRETLRTLTDVIRYDYASYTSIYIYT